MRAKIEPDQQGANARLLDVLESRLDSKPYHIILSPQAVFALLLLYTVCIGGTAFGYAYTFLSYGLIALCCGVPVDRLLHKEPEEVRAALLAFRHAVWCGFRLRVLAYFIALGSIAWLLDLSTTAQVLLAASPPLLRLVDCFSRPSTWRFVGAAISLM
jgi:hypothetical protein